MTELPARPIAGPVRTNIEPPIIPAIPIITTSSKPNERTSLCSWGWIGLSGSLISDIYWDSSNSTTIYVYRVKIEFVIRYI